MSKSNFERMIELAQDVFAAKSDPEQLDVDEEVIKQLEALHPASVSEYDEGDGPAIWMLLIPTTKKIMQDFLDKIINEKEILSLTPLNTKYEALYLCSAMTLPEYRGKGLSKKIALDAIKAIRKDHPISHLFVWPFTKEGDALAQRLATCCGLPLLSRKSEH